MLWECPLWRAWVSRYGRNVCSPCRSCREVRDLRQTVRSSPRPFDRNRVAGNQSAQQERSM